MGSYKIVIKKSATKDLAAIPGRDRDRIIGRIRSLADDPRPPGSLKLSGEEKYRIRPGDYRILYEIEDDVLIVVVVRIGHRRDVYER